MNGNIEKEILEYFNSNKNIAYKSGFLKVLDNKYRRYYTGVSLQYVVYDLLKAKYRKSDVCKVLYDLIERGTLTAIYCPNVKKIVFENLHTGHTRYFNTSKEKVLEYLKSFIR